MAGEDVNNERNVFCTNCGESISADAEFCPECGAQQGPGETTSSDESESDGPPTVDKIAKIVSWGLGALFVLGGLAGLISNPAFAIIILLLGLFLLPPVRSRLEEQIDYQFGRWMVVGIVLVGMMIGGAIAPDTTGNGDTAPSGSQNGDELAASTPTPEPAPAFAVRVIYSSSWSGAISITGGGSSETKSVSGSGTETIEITGDVDIISANAQKQDDSTEELTIQILQNGDVVAEASTTAEYGVAQVSESF